jgi:hypothetical protein
MKGTLEHQKVEFYFHSSDQNTCFQNFSDIFYVKGLKPIRLISQLSRDNSCFFFYLTFRYCMHTHTHTHTHTHAHTYIYIYMTASVV